MTAAKGDQSGAFGVQEEPTSQLPPAGERQQGTAKRKRSMRPFVVTAVVLGAALTVFIFQNGGEVPVTWLFVTVNGPLWAVIVASAAAGALLSQVVAWIMRRKRRRKRTVRPPAST